jgi:iron(III) transport system permease protein
VGVTLALMEVLADFGTVAIFNYSTFTVAIYRVWFGLFDRSAATELAGFLLLFTLLLYGLERGQRVEHVSIRLQGVSVPSCLNS